MFVYGANFFLYKPGLALLALGLLLTVPLSLGPITIGAVTLSHHWMLLGVSLAVLGLQCVYMGILSQVFFDYAGPVADKWFRRFRYTRAVGLSALLFGAGFALSTLLGVHYLRNNFRLSLTAAISYLGVTGLLLMIAGVHVLGLAIVAILMIPALRDDPDSPPHSSDSGSDEGWGRGPRKPPRQPNSPIGGLPLPDAVPARVRLRSMCGARSLASSRLCASRPPLAASRLNTRAT